MHKKGPRGGETQRGQDGDWGAVWEPGEAEVLKLLEGKGVAIRGPEDFWDQISDSGIPAPLFLQTQSGVGSWVGEGGLGAKAQPVAGVVESHSCQGQHLVLSAICSTYHIGAPGHKGGRLWGSLWVEPSDTQVGKGGRDRANHRRLSHG